MQPDERVLVTGSGGVSTFALQLARAAGASVCAISGSADGRRQLAGLGADPVIDRVAAPGWGQAILEATGGVHKVVDTIGMASVNESLGALGHAGEVAMVGLMDMDGPAPGFALFGKSLRGVMVGDGAMYAALSASSTSTASCPSSVRASGSTTRVKRCARRRRRACSARSSSSPEPTCPPALVVRPAQRCEIMPSMATNTTDDPDSPPAQRNAGTLRAVLTPEQRRALMVRSDRAGPSAARRPHPPRSSCAAAGSGSVCRSGRSRCWCTACCWPFCSPRCTSASTGRPSPPGR